MADIRINALATTATTPASDDYLALDGAAQGTRKILATNIANNVTDVILGTSGPSVKSTLSARAPRQGLVFDGTAGATTNVPAFGTADFSVSFISRLTDVSVAQSIVSGTAGALILNISGALYLYKQGTGSLGSVAGVFESGKIAQITVTRSGTSVIVYKNGIQAGTMTIASTNFTGATGFIGSTDGTNEKATGLIGGLLIYNRALSASEVVSLYEAGAPAGADYPSQVAGTALITGNNSTFAGAGNWTNWGSGSITVSSGVGNFSAGGTLVGAAYAAAYLNVASTVRALVRYRISADVTAISSGNIVVMNGVDGALIGTLSSTTGTGKTLEFTAPSNANGLFGLGSSVSGATFTLDNVTLVAVGLLLAPDAAQAGGGLVWYDTSGNAANITLPASGVSWNVPSSAKVATGWAFGGDVGIGTTSPTAIGSSRVTQINSTTGNTSFLLFSTNSTLNGSLYANASETSLGSISSIPLLFKTADVEKARITSGGNYLIGTTTDGGQKLQVSGDIISTSTSGSNIIANDPTFNHPVVQLREAGTNKAAFETVSGDAYVSTQTAGKSLYLRSGNGTTALTLDSSQQVITASNLAVGGTATSQRLHVNVDVYGASKSGGMRIGNSGNNYYSDLLVTTDSSSNPFVKLSFATHQLFQYAYGGGGNSWTFYTNNTTALTLDSSQRCILSGALRLNNAYTAGAPTATGYVTIQDSAGNTYKVLVGT